MVLSGSIVESSVKLRRDQRPWQSGQAPVGELNEKCESVSVSGTAPHSGHRNVRENISIGVFFFFSSKKYIPTTSSPCSKEVDIDWESLSVWVASVLSISTRSTIIQGSETFSGRTSERL